jgi:chemotaxis protein MotB
MAGKGGGAWKVAYADFVTAMMAFFMVMWLVSQSQETRDAVAVYFRDPFAMQDGKQGGNGKVHLAPTQLRQTTAEGGKGANVPNQSGKDAASRRSEVPVLQAAKDDRQFSVLFDLDSADINDESRKVLASSIEMLKGKFNRVEIRGHCVRKPLPTDSQFANHWDLCYARCMVVKKELIDGDVNEWRIRLSQAEGNEPLNSKLNDSELKFNSRVDVFLLPDITHMPWNDTVEAASAPAAEHGEKVSHESSHGEQDSHAKAAEHGH